MKTLFALILALSLAVSARATDHGHYFDSLLGSGVTSVTLSNNATITPATTGVWFTNGFGGLRAYFTNSFMTTNYQLVNGISTAVVTTNVITVNPPAFAPATDVRADANGQVNPNVSVSVTAVGNDAAMVSTNTVVLASSVHGTNYGTTAANQFTFTYIMTGVTPVTFTTNLPSSFLYGASKISLVSHAVSNTASNCILTDLGIGGFEPRK